VGLDAVGDRIEDLRADATVQPREAWRGVSGGGHERGDLGLGGFFGDGRQCLTGAGIGSEDGE
jgi:hypothetical protein